MDSWRWTVVSVAWVALSASGCAAVPVSLVRVGPTDPGVSVSGLLPCGGAGGGEVELDPDRPLVLFVPGRDDPGTRYRELATRFEQEGRQAACFDYHGRESIAESSGRLIRALEQLEARLSPSRLLLVGHGQGGLIARRALVRERPDALRTRDGFTYGLVTVAAPLGGVQSSADCGRLWIHVLTLGASALACHLVAGESWQELLPGSGLVTHPGTLLGQVRQALEIVTNERGACRRRGVEGTCAVPDSRFSLAEQANQVVEGDPRLRRIEVTAGHEEIVGEVGAPPEKLIALLETEGLLAPPMRVATQ